MEIFWTIIAYIFSIYFFGILPTFFIIFSTMWIMGKFRYDYNPSRDSLSDEQRKKMYLRFFIFSTILGIAIMRLVFGKFF